MKKTLLLALTLIAVGCAEPEPNPRNTAELVQQGDVWLDRETLEPYSGPVFGLFANDSSRIEYRFTVKNGVKDGLYEEYNENGQLEWNYVYKDGDVLDGPRETYYDNGQLEERGTLKDGGWDGDYESYYQDGGLITKGVYIDGEECGKWIKCGWSFTYRPSLKIVWN